MSKKVENEKPKGIQKRKENSQTKKKRKEQKLSKWGWMNQKKDLSTIFKKRPFCGCQKFRGNSVISNKSKKL